MVLRSLGIHSTVSAIEWLMHRCHIRLTQRVVVQDFSPSGMITLNAGSQSVATLTRFLENLATYEGCNSEHQIAASSLTVLDSRPCLISLGQVPAMSKAGTEEESM